MNSHDMTRCRVMVVDNSLEILALIEELLRPYGVDLLTVSMPEAAVKQAAGFAPHAVYLGLEFLDCDGWDLAQRLRRLPELRKTMLVGLVDRGNGWQSEDGKGDRGFDYYLPKPPTMKDIIKAMTNESPS